MRLPRPKVTRDGFLFAFGIAGVTYQTVIEHLDRPTLLILFAGCLGFPVFLRADESRKTKKDEEAP